MATYVVGDIHGNLPTLEALLKKVQFSSVDALVSIGDLVNRGKYSLELIRWFMQEPRFTLLLGNHDFFAAISACFGIPLSAEKTVGDSHPLASLRDAPDAQKIGRWLLSRQVLLYFPEHNFIAYHAGLYPEWGIDGNMHHAKKIEAFLQTQPPAIIAKLLGDTPKSFEKCESKFEKMRFRLNVFTRLRYLSADGKELVLDKSDNPHEKKALEVPYFTFLTPDWRTLNGQVIQCAFGHWAALHGQTMQKDIWGLDHGCGWKRELACLRLETCEKFVQNYCE